MKLTIKQRSYCKAGIMGWLCLRTIATPFFVGDTAPLTKEEAAFRIALHLLVVLVMAVAWDVSE